MSAKGRQEDPGFEASAQEPEFVKRRDDDENRSSAQSGRSDAVAKPRTSKGPSSVNLVVSLLFRIAVLTIFGIVAYDAHEIKGILHAVAVSQERVSSQLLQTNGRIDALDKNFREIATSLSRIEENTRRSAQP